MEFLKGSFSMQVTNKAQIVVQNNTNQGEKVVGAINSKTQESTGKGFSSNPAAIFKNSTKDDYDTSTLNPLQKRVLSLQEQMTNLNSDEKMDNDTKSSQLKSLQEEFESVQEQMLKQQQETFGEDTRLDTELNMYGHEVGKDLLENLPREKSADWNMYGHTIDLTDPNYYQSQDYKELVEQLRKDGKTDDEIYECTHSITLSDWKMDGKIERQVGDIVKDVCAQYGFDYYERLGHRPKMEGILQGNGMKAYEVLSQVFSDYERDIWEARSRREAEFSEDEYAFIGRLQQNTGVNIVSAEDAMKPVYYTYDGRTCNISRSILRLMAKNPQQNEVWKQLAQGGYENLGEVAEAIAKTGDMQTAEAIKGKDEGTVFTHDKGGLIWDIMLAPTPDPNDTRDPSKFVGKAGAGMAKNDTLLVNGQDAQKDDTAKKEMSQLHRRMLLLQAQITKLNRDKKIDEETKSHLIKSLQGQLLSVMELMEQ